MGTCKYVISLKQVFLLSRNACLKQVNHFEDVEDGVEGMALNVLYFFVHFREEGFGQSQAGA